MAKVLGLSFFYHDSTAALVVDGRALAAASEERFCRRKHTHEFPKQAIEYCLEQAGLASINELDAIVFYEKPVIKFQRLLETATATWPFSLVNFSRKFPPFLKDKLNVYGVIRENLPGYKGRILFSDHHLSHAAAAYFGSPFDEAAILTLDGVGEKETTTLGYGRGVEIELSRSLQFPHSIGLLYAALTSYLGFKVNDGEWKVMGLAPYGQPKYVEQFQRLVHTRVDGSFALDLKYFSFHYSPQSATNDARWEELFGVPRRAPQEPLGPEHADLARSGQVVVEELILQLAREARKISGSKNLVIAGGVGLNSVANTRIEREGIFENVWIHPAPGDDGAALGAALLVSHQVFKDPRTQGLEHAYLGPGFDDREIEMFLKSRGIRAERMSERETARRTASLLASGKVVGWFQGRMEFGPRALGARSILADPREAAMKATLNEKIKYREPFRPFAPVIPLEFAADYFETKPGAEYPYMIKVLPVHAGARAKIPAVTHEDGSARVQTVTPATNALLHQTLLDFNELTGVPVLVNTSFNVRGEPIVCTPDDAYRCFLQTGIDVLVMGSFLIDEKPLEAAAAVASGYERSDDLEAVGTFAKKASRSKVSRRRTRDSLLMPQETTSSQNGKASASETQSKVLRFYQQLPFNVYSNAVDNAEALMRKNPLKEYPPLMKHLEKLGRASGSSTGEPQILDIGCGSGWFVNSCAHHFGLRGVGLDLNPVVIKQASAVARLINGPQQKPFKEQDLFSFQPGQKFAVVNSLGVLHHTPDCFGAVRRALNWVADDGYLHLGLYHKQGREPFLRHFTELKAQGFDEVALFEEFKRLNPEMKDETLLLSWFRDQVLHPHETQHSFGEIEDLLHAEGFEIESTSLNHFRGKPVRSQIERCEEDCRAISEKALRKQGRYFPGFFVVWAKRRPGFVKTKNETSGAFLN